MTSPLTVLALGWDRAILEIKVYFREKDQVFFSFLFPVLMLALFATVFQSQFEGPDNEAIGLSAARFFLPGMMAAGVLLTSFQTMALTVATERDDGTLKRLRATPMPPVAYFLGKVGLVLVTSVLQSALLLLMARVLFDVQLPTEARQWVTLGWVFGLGVVSGTVLGIAYSSLATSARSAGAAVIGPVLVLQFISGVYFSFEDIPQWLKEVASLFPLKWIAQGMRSVFYPDSFASREMAGVWEHGRIALVLVAWAIGGLVLCTTTFRWFKRGST